MTVRRASTIICALTCLAIAVVVALAVPAPSFAQSYSMGPVDIAASVLPNGDMTVTERRTFSFDGDFTFVVWTLDKAGSDNIEIVSMSQEVDGQLVPMAPTTDPLAIDTRPPGAYLVQDSGDQVEVRAFHRTSDDDATFVLEYVVTGAAVRWADTGELYWKFIGDQSEVGVSDVTIDIAPPAPLTKADVKAWAHGPLTGVVSIAEDAVVTLSAPEVPPLTFVEARVLYPASALAAAPLVDEPRLEEVLAEEAKLANAANAERLQARAIFYGGTGISWIAALVALFVMVRAFLKHGREHRAEFPGGYFREDPAPELHPAVVGALWRFGTVNDTDIAATLMDLADKGHIHMAPVETPKGGIGGMFGGTDDTFQLTRTNSSREPLSALDAELMRLLFDKVGGGANQMTLADLKEYAKAHAETFSAAIKDWKESAAAEAQAKGFFEADSATWQVLAFVAAAIVAAIGIAVAFLSGSFWPALVPVPIAIVIAVLAVSMNRRSREGNELYRKYVALRDFLRDFSRLEEAPPASVILWNRFLVLAVVFGIAEEVIAQLRVKMPEVVADPAFQTTYWWVYAGSHGSSPVSSISTSFVSAAQVATSQMSGASGGGGGFSGGGGGGGGGGGVGAG